MVSNFLENFDISKLNILSNPLKMFFPKKMVGIDIATASVKVVEISNQQAEKLPFPNCSKNCLFICLTLSRMAWVFL